MAYLGDAVIDEVLTFYANTSDPTAEGNPAADADSVPSYRVYEDETGTPLLTGNMAKLDDSNTLGFYSEAITLSAANGFEIGKTYCIFITATVNSKTGSKTDTFKVVVNPTLDGSNRPLVSIDAASTAGNTALQASGLALAGEAASALNAFGDGNGNLNANIARVNDVPVAGDGDGTPWGPA